MPLIFIYTHIEFDEFVCDEIFSWAALTRLRKDDGTDGTSIIVVSIHHWWHIIPSFDAP